MQAHFGAITYDIEIGRDLELHKEGLVGETISHQRSIKIRTTVHDEPITESYVRETILHELLHAACHAVGFRREDEEDIVNALGAGLHQLLEDDRNNAVVSRLIPWLHADFTAPAPRLGVAGVSPADIYCDVQSPVSGLYCDGVRGHDLDDALPPPRRLHNYTRPDLQSGPLRKSEIDARRNPQG